MEDTKPAATEITAHDPPAASGPNDGGLSVVDGLGTIPCPAGGGPTMVRLPQGYCIDSTEVTRLQYATWLTTSPSANQQDSWCSWNTSFVPSAGCMGQRYVCAGGNDSGSCDSFPQVCVDWCDAQAYCKAMGKRLCGKRGGGPNAFADYASASASQWYNACVSGEANNVYVYGNTYDSSACNGPENAPAQQVGHLPQCQSPTSGYAGVYDLTGNVWEWEDSCDGSNGAGDLCRQRGGSFGGGIRYDAGNQRCDEDSPFPREHAHVNLGFRCCAD